MDDPSPQSSPSSETQTDWVYDVTIDQFERKVLAASREVPIVVDFHATWCQPCLMLGPVLEQAVMEKAGQVRLAKINSDEEPELAARYQVQALPTVLAIFQGEVIEGFQGMQTEPQLAAWLDRIIPSEADLRYQEGMKLFKEDPEEAQACFRIALQADEKHLPTRIALAKLLVKRGRLDQAQEIADTLQATGDLEYHAPDLAATLALAKQAQAAGSVEDCRARYQENPEDLQAKLHLGQALLATEQFEEGLQLCLEVVQEDKKGLGQPAKESMVHAFQVLGNESDLVFAFRSKLSSALF
ncbi:Hypothetical protein PBC10988_33480 [Planctomycetales bacterium 10988]|nr:Hypothetical protein PBC10988_33480 [Planctomycetales bacterium 10988]